jgi:hypothetical protein
MPSVEVATRAGLGRVRIKCCRPAINKAHPRSRTINSDFAAILVCADKTVLNRIIGLLII